MVLNNILEAMGNTPIIKLSKMALPESADILVKFEGLNVGGSIKTRTAYNMIARAEKDGLIRASLAVQNSSNEISRFLEAIDKISSKSKPF